jgi:hypothetical protein
VVAVLNGRTGGSGGCFKQEAMVAVLNTVITLGHCKLPECHVPPGDRELCCVDIGTVIILRNNAR